MAGLAQASGQRTALLSLRQFFYFWGFVATCLLLAAPFAESVVALAPSCHFRSYFNLPCPTCGATTTAYHLARFEPLAALRVSPLATSVWCGSVLGGIVLAVGVWLDRSGRFLRKIAEINERFDTRVKRRGAHLLLAGIALNWAYMIALN